MPLKNYACNPCALYAEGGLYFKKGKVGGIFILDSLVKESAKNAQILSEQLKKQGVSLSGTGYYWATALKCVMSKREYTNKEIKESIRFCSRHVVTAIEEAKPRMVIGMGEYAPLSLLEKTKLTDVKGKFLLDKKDNLPMFFMQSPTYALENCDSDIFNAPFALLPARVKDLLMNIKRIAAFIKDNYSDLSLDTKGYVRGTKADLKKIGKAKMVAVDFEAINANTRSRANKPLSVSFSIDTGNSYVYFYPKDKELVKGILTGDQPKLLAARPFDEQVCQNMLGITMGGDKHDVLPLAHIIDETYYRYNLENIASLYANMPNIKDLAEGYRKNLLDAPEDVLVRYNGVDTDATFRSAQNQFAILNKPENAKLKNYYLKFIVPVQNMCSRIVSNGVRIDRKKLRENEETAIDLLDQLHKEGLALIPKSILKAHEEKGYKFTRDALIRDVLFKGYKLKPRKDYVTEKTQAISVCEDHLKCFPLNPFASLLIRYNKLEKVYSSYLKTMYDHIQDDERIYPTISLTRTKTGRSVMLNPPVQTFPQRGEFAYLCKEVIVADEGWVFGARDMAQSELRIMGWLANDRAIMNALHQGIDLHTQTAARTNGIPINKVTKPMRQGAKGVNFGLIYGMSASGLQRYLQEEYNITWDIDQCMKVRDQFFSLYNGLPVFYDKMKLYMQQHGYAETILGRRRRLPNLLGSNQRLINDAYRQGINIQGQGFSSDLGFIGMFLFEEALRKEKLDKHVKPTWFIHDSSMFLAKEKYVDHGMALLKDCMEERSKVYIQKNFGVTIGYPIASDGKVGTSLATMQEV